jgi:hypothetical protein
MKSDLDFKNTFESKPENDRKGKIHDYPMDLPSEKIHALAGILDFYGFNRDLTFDW